MSNDEKPTIAVDKPAETDAAKIITALEDLGNGIAGINESMEMIATSLAEIAEAFQNCTFSVNSSSDARAIRTCDIGD